MPVKLGGPGDRGKPDRLFVGPGGRTLFVEFKAPGKRPRKLQLWFFSQMSELGHCVQVIDNVEDGCALFD